jgi:hypothetical protein
LAVLVNEQGYMIGLCHYTCFFLTFFLWKFKEQQTLCSGGELASTGQLNLIVTEPFASFIMCTGVLWREEADKDVALPCADDIESHIESANAATVQGNRQLVKAVKTQKSGSSIVSITIVHGWYSDKMLWQMV